MVQNLDFAQTFLEAAMINIPDDMQGESLMPLLTGNNENGIEKRFIIITMNTHLYIWSKGIMELLVKIIN